MHTHFRSWTPVTSTSVYFESMRGACASRKADDVGVAWPLSLFVGNQRNVKHARGTTRQPNYRRPKRHSSFPSLPFPDQVEEAADANFEDCILS